MAMLSSMKNHSNSSSNYSTQRTSSESSRRQNTTASAYVVNAHTSVLTGFHYTTCGAGGELFSDWGGWFEVPSGVPSPPTSPRIEGRRLSPVRRISHRSGGSGDAAHNITEECERLFCETLKSVFLVEKNTALEDSLVMGAQSDCMGEHTLQRQQQERGGQTAAQFVPDKRTSPPTRVVTKHGLPTPATSPGTHVFESGSGMIKAYLEMHDYAIDATFRGFIAEKDDECSMFVFFDKDVIGQDLKPGLTALLELSSTEGLDCERLLVCVPRITDHEATADLIKDLGWVGFELATLQAWTDIPACTSEDWIMLSMDV